MLEVIVAMFIFGCIAATLFKAMTIGDKIKGRGSLVTYASTLAANEMEQIRAKAFQHDTLIDTMYSEIVNGRTFEISRHILEKEKPILLAQPSPNEPVEVQVLIKDVATSSQFSFRMLQGKPDAKATK